MRKVKLSDVCDISSGGTPSRSNPAYFKGDIPWAKISDIESSENGVVYATEEHISIEGLRNIRGKLFPKGTLLFAMYGSIGKVGISGRELSTNQAILGIRPRRDDEIDLHYLKCWFASNKQKLINQGRGVALKNLSATIVRDLEIELPHLNDQIRIAHLLGIIEGLIARRKQHLQQLDDLLKSVFLEMFGPSNPDHTYWPLVEIRDLAAKHKGAMRTGPFGSNLLHSEFTPEGDAAVLGIDNAVQNRFSWGERRFISNEKYLELQSYRIFPGDVIVTIMGTIGRSAVVPDDIPVAINTKHLAAITLNQELANPLFLSYSIHSSPSILKQFASKNRGAIMSGLNLGIIKETKIRRPPIGLQNCFAEIHVCVDRLKFRYQDSLSDLEALYSALSQKAFKGELNLSLIDSTDRRIQSSNPTGENQQSPNYKQHLKHENSHLLATLEGRIRFLRQMFDEAISELRQGDDFDVDMFFINALLESIDFVDENSEPFGVAEYERLKKWIFEMLDSCRLEQRYDEFLGLTLFKSAD